MSSFILLLLSSSICRNVDLLHSLLSHIILSTFACFVLLFSSRNIEILSLLRVETIVDLVATFPIALRVRVCFVNRLLR